MDFVCQFLRPTELCKCEKRCNSEFWSDLFDVILFMKSKFAIFELMKVHFSYLKYCISNPFLSVDGICVCKKWKIFYGQSFESLLSYYSMCNSTLGEHFKLYDFYHFKENIDAFFFFFYIFWCKKISWFHVFFIKVLKTV